MPKTRDPCWNHVTLVAANRWRCNHCGHEAGGGLTRIKAHLHRSPRFGIKPCNPANSQERSAEWQAKELIKSPSNLEGSFTFPQGPHQLGSASNKDDWRERASAPMYDISTAGTSSLPFVSVHETNFPNQSAQTMIQRSETPSQPQLTHAVDFDMHPCNWPHPSSSRDLTPVALTGIQSPRNAGTGDLRTQGRDGGYQIHDHRVVNDQVRSEAVQASNLTWVPHQLAFAGNENAQRDTSITPAAVVGSSGFVSAPVSHQPCSDQTYLQQSPALEGLLYNPCHSSSLDVIMDASANTQCPPNAEVRVLNPEVQQGRDGGYQIHDHRVVNDQVGSEAVQASNLTWVPHRLAFAENENAQRDTSITPAAVVGSSGFVSAPVSHQPCSDQTYLQQSPALEGLLYNPCHSSSLDVIMDASANTQCPPNAEVRVLNPEVQQGKRARVADPLSNCFEVPNGYGGAQFFGGHSAGDGIDGSRVVDGGVRSEALQTYKHKRMVVSSNRHDNAEWSANITQCSLTSSLFQSSNDIRAVIGTNLPYNSHLPQTMSQERHPWNLDGPLNAGGDLPIAVRQGLGSFEGESGPSNRGLTDDNGPSCIAKLEELINRFKDDRTKFKLKFKGMLMECSRSPTPQKLAEMEEWMKKFETYFNL